MTSRDDVLFCAELSARYHRRRASFLDRCSSAMSVVILTGGLGAFAGLVGDATLFAKIATLAIAIVGIIQIIFQVDRCAADHRRWLGRWNKIIVQARHHEHPSLTELRAWDDERYELESECVSELRALQVDCFNRTMIALGHNGRPTPMRWWHRAFIQILSFEGSFADPEPA